MKKVYLILIAFIILSFIFLLGLYIGFKITGNQVFNLTTINRPDSSNFNLSSFTNQTCEDTDFLNDPYVFGKVNGSELFNNLLRNYEKNDTCIGGGTAVRQYYCQLSSNNLPPYNNLTTPCPNGCTNGICNPCVPNWVPINLGCRGDLNITTYVDSRSCGIGSKDNETLYCDENNNNLIGEQNCSYLIGLDGIYINETSVSEASSPFRGKSLVELFKGYAYISFYFNFSSTRKLNICNMNIETASPDEKNGYIIVKNAEYPKKYVAFLKLNDSSDSVCIIDSNNIDSVSDFSRSCNKSKEYLVPCNGIETNMGFICEIKEGDDGENYFFVGPLNHSAVKEFVRPSNPNQTISCIPNWIYGTYGDCINGTKTRTVYDLNNCGLPPPFPTTENCSVGPPPTPSPNNTINNTDDDSQKEGETNKLKKAFIISQKEGETNKLKKAFIILSIIFGIILIALTIIYFILRNKGFGNKLYPNENKNSPSIKPSPPLSPGLPIKSSPLDLKPITPPTPKFYTPRPISKNPTNT